MKRFSYLAVLMLLSSSAYAGSSFSFVVGGHQIHVEASRHCRSLSCVSAYEERRGRDRHDDSADAPVVAEVPARAPAPVPAPAAPVACQPPAQPVVSAPAPAPKPPAAVNSTDAIAPAPPATIQASRTPPVASAPPPLPVVKPTPAIVPSSPAAIRPSNAAAPANEKPADATRPAAKILKASDEVEANPADTPRGDWRIEGKNRSVRIEQCGGALCGYVLNTSSDGKEEPVLINMKPNGPSAWTGNIYSRDSGDTFYGKITMHGPNTLRVEACAWGRFFCSGKDWIRNAANPEITSSQASAPPRT